MSEAKAHHAGDATLSLIGGFKLLSLDDRKLKAIGAGTFFYAALLLTEGIGLLLRRRWAEYFTVIVTARSSRWSCTSWRDTSA